MNKLKAHLGSEDTEARQQWAIAVAQSQDYVKTLGLSAKDLNQMEADRVMIVPNSPSNCLIFTRHVCAVPYGSDWTNILQVQITGRKVHYSKGGGTTYFTTLDESTHRTIVESFEAEAYEVSGTTKPTGHDPQAHEAWAKDGDE